MVLYRRSRNDDDRPNAFFPFPSAQTIWLPYPCSLLFKSWSRDRKIYVRIALFYIVVLGGYSYVDLTIVELDSDMLKIAIYGPHFFTTDSNVACC